MAYISSAPSTQKQQKSVKIECNLIRIFFLKYALIKELCKPNSWRSLMLTGLMSINFNISLHHLLNFDLLNELRWYRSQTQWHTYLLGIQSSLHYSLRQVM